MPGPAESPDHDGEVAALVARLRELRPDLAVVPREMSYAMFLAARDAKLASSNMDFKDWVEAPAKEDLPHLGITWPESPWDRWSTINEEVHELLLSTAWRAAVTKGEVEEETR